MTRPARSSPNGRSIGAEPAGATPLDEGDLEGLLADFVATRGDLNRVEFESITASLPRLLEMARAGGPGSVLDYSFLLEVHRRMFGDVWRWAGTLRRRDTNIGVDKALVDERTVQCLEQARFWHADGIYSADERAVRLHAGLVSVHHFPNGNGRCTRLMADLYLTSIGEPTFTWGSAGLEVDGATRDRYLTTLLDALTTGNYSALIAFARS